jgi:tRNA (pseudouridine54-N1)-methyltransferase
MDDLAGAAGRWDLLARCVQSALFVSHDLRRDTELVLVLLGPPSPPKAIRVSGALVQRLNPDERSTVALLSRALELPLPPGGAEVMSSQGVYVSRADLLAVLDTPAPAPASNPTSTPAPFSSAPGGRRLVLLDESGRHGGPERLPEAVGPDPTFVIGDDRGLTGDQLDALRARGAVELSLGPVSLHADHCIVVVHNLLDRAGAAGAAAATAATAGPGCGR